MEKRPIYYYWKNFTANGTKWKIIHNVMIIPDRVKEQMLDWRRQTENKEPSNEADPVHIKYRILIQNTIYSIR